MGFNLGRALGKLAGGFVGKVTGGLIQPRINFNPPSRPGTPTLFVGQQPQGIDSTVTRTGPLWGLGGSTTTSYYTKGSGVDPGTGMQVGTQPYPFDAAGVMAYCYAKAGRGRVMKVPSPCPGFHWNARRYYVFGDCRTGSPAGEVAPNTRLVRNRRINPANGKAAMHALRRVSATHHLLSSLDKHLQALARRAVHRGGARRGAKSGCGCKGKCTC